MTRKWSHVLGIVTLSVLACSCAKNDSVRTYTEYVIASKNKPAASEHHNHDHDSQNIPSKVPVEPSEASSQSLSWNVPEGWEEKGGSGLRLATMLPDPTQPQFECTIVSLSSQAGDIPSNVKRWMGQLGLAIPAGEAFDSFIGQQEKFQTPDQSQGTLIDFNSLVSEQGLTQSMLAGMIATPSKTIFVKLTGTPEFLGRYRQDFLALCRSVKDRP